MELNDSLQIDNHDDIDRVSNKAMQHMPPTALLPQEMQLPRFSHLPPPSIQGSDRWPASLEAQALPLTETPELIDILIWLTPYLEVDDTIRLKCISTQYRRGPGFGPL